jgi:ABC-type transport system substrate-binding protein
LLAVRFLISPLLFPWFFLGAVGSGSAAGLTIGVGADVAAIDPHYHNVTPNVNKEKGFGTANRGHYSNAKVDLLLEEVLVTVDDAKREALLERATELAINELLAAHRRVHAHRFLPPR